MSKKLIITILVFASAILLAVLTPSILRSTRRDAQKADLIANHLYDFAQNIASLFLDYEDTRPDTLNKVLSKQNWQQKLYNDVIGETGLKFDSIKYLTLFQLA